MVARMSAPANTGREPEDLAGEDPIDLRRYLAGLRRSWALMLAIVVVVTGVAVTLSLTAVKTYRTTAKLVLVESGSSLGVEAASRRLATVATLLTTPDVLGKAAARVPGERADSLHRGVTSSVDQGTGIISVSDAASSAERSARIANAVVDVFLEREQERAANRIERARDRLAEELRALPETPTGRAQARAIREQLSALAVTGATTGPEFELAERASPARADVSPRSLRNGVLALFASLFLAVLVALGRDQLVPRVAGPRELSRLTGLPVLAKVPGARLGLRRRPRVVSGAARAAYEILQTRITEHLPAPEQRVILITSALSGDGKTQVVAGLGRALAHEGYHTLMIAADLRLPTLHEHFGLPLTAGVAELLADHLVEGYTPDEAAITELLSEPLVRGPRTGELRLLPAGRATTNPSRLLASELVGRLFHEVNRLDYDYVLVDSPPLIGLPDSPIIAPWCDAVLVVARPDRMALESVADLTDVLERIETAVLGLVTVGSRQTEIGARYYAGDAAFD